MPGTGNTTVNFGSASTPRTQASVVVTGQADILSTSLVEAWLRLEATADHSVDEHRAHGPRVMAGAIVEGVGFTIYAEAFDRQDYGEYSVNWVWY